jgi:hypothetical protein
MADKEPNKKIQDEKEPENKTKDNEPENKSDNSNFNISVDDLEDLLDQIKKDYNLDGKNVKIVRVEKRKLSWKEQILNIVITYLFDFTLLVSISGYLGFTEKIGNLLIFSLIFSTIESVLRSLMMKYFAKLMFLSLGTISIPITALSFLFSMMIFRITINNDRVILFLIIFLFLRLILKMVLMRRNREKFIDKIKGGKL